MNTITKRIPGLPIDTSFPDTFNEILEQTFGNLPLHKQEVFIEDPDAYIAEIETPRFDRESLELTIENDVIHVTGRIKDGEMEYRLNRDINLPEGIDAAAITATAKNGILTVRFPKAESLKPRKITVS